MCEDLVAWGENEPLNMRQKLQDVFKRETETEFRSPLDVTPTACDQPFIEVLMTAFTIAGLAEKVTN